MSVIIPILITFHVLVCLLMIGVVLMQRPKNEGLGAAFGGGMTENIFGAQTTHVLQKFTVWLGIIFFILTLSLAMIYAKRGTGETSIQRELLAQPIPAAAAPATAEATDTAPAADAKPEVSVITAETTGGVQAVTILEEEPATTAPPAAAEETAAGAVPAPTAAD